MQLIDLIPDLLFKHNCVIIPEFGGFVANFKSARFNEERLLASPAIKRVAFNQSLTENDGLLIKEFSRVNDITYAEAEKEVSNFVKFLKGRLDQYNNYEFKNIGSFYLNKEGRIVFVAYEGLNFYPNSYGLADVKVKRLERNIDEQRISERQIRNPEVHNPELDCERHIPWRAVAAVVVVLVAFSFIIWQIAGNTAEPDLATIDNDSQNVASIVSGTAEDSFAEATQTEDDLTDPSTSQPEEHYTQSEAAEAADETYFDEHTEEIPYHDEYVETTEIAASQPEDRLPEVIEEDKSEPDQKLENAVRESDAIPMTLSELREIRKAHFGDEEIYYIVVHKSSEYSDIDRALKTYKSRSFDAFVVDGMKKGEKAVCLERFYDRQNANEYLRLIRNYEQIQAEVMAVTE